MPVRTGKLHGETRIVIPYFDTDGNRQYSLITIKETIYASKIYAGIRQFVLDNFGVKVDKDWLHNVPLIANENDPKLKITEEKRNAMIESLIDSWELKDDEIEDLTDCGDQREDADEAEEQVRPVSCERDCKSMS